MNLNFDECDIIAGALQEYADNHPDNREAIDAIADRIVAHQSSEAEA